MKNSLLFVFIAFLLVSCGPMIYLDPQIGNITSQHSQIAILPPTVSIEAKKKVDVEALIEQQKTESVNFQKEMYSWLLKRKAQEKLTVDVQNVETTIVLLKKAGYYDGQHFTPQELADILNVDAVLSSNYSLSKPVSEGAAIAMAVLFGAFAPTNKTVVDLSLHNRSDGNMFWNYNHKASGTFSSPNDLVENLMRNASRKLPYYIN